MAKSFDFMMRNHDPAPEELSVAVPGSNTDLYGAPSIQLPEKYAAGGPSVRVLCCGRWCTVGLQDAQSVSRLTNAVREELKMNRNCPLHVRDSSNRPLRTDQEVAEAVREGAGTPLNVVMTDAALTEMEKRKDEMSQMQWQLLRDHMAEISDQLQEKDRKIMDLTEKIEHLTVQFGGDMLQAELETKRLLNEEAKSREQAVREVYRAIQRENGKEYQAEVQRELETLRRDMTEAQRDCRSYVSSCQETSAAATRTFNDEVDRLRKTDQHAQEEVKLRLAQLEKWILQAEGTTVDQKQSLTQECTSLKTQVDMLGRMLETELAERKTNEAVVRDLAAELMQLKGNLSHVEASVVQGLTNERQARQELVSSQTEKIGIQERKLHDLNFQMTSKLRAESQSRQEAQANLMQNVANTLDSMKRGTGPQQIGGDGRVRIAVQQIEGEFRAKSQNGYYTNPLLGAAANQPAAIMDQQMLVQQMLVQRSQAAMAPGFGGPSHTPRAQSPLPVQGMEAPATTKVQMESAATTPKVAAAPFAFTAVTNGPPNPPPPRSLSRDTASVAAADMAAAVF